MTYMRDFYEVMLRCDLQPPPFDEWRAFYSDNAAFWPLIDNGSHKLIGGVMFKGQHVHIAVAPEWQGRWVNKALMRAYKSWGHPGEVFATIPQENTRAIEFAKRLGFVYRSSERGFEILVKEPACQQQSSLPY